MLAIILLGMVWLGLFGISITVWYRDWRRYDLEQYEKRTQNNRKKFGLD